MKRLRLTLLGLALLMAIPVILLVSRALASIAIEEEDHHEAVAEQAFAIMARELGDLLDREQDRPVGHYRNVFVPAGTLKGSTALARSPLADGPQESYIKGYFQVDPDGTVQSPVTRGTNPTQKAEVLKDETLQDYADTIRKVDSSRSLTREKGRRGARTSQLEGTTVPLGKKARQRKEREQRSPKASKQLSAPSMVASDSAELSWPQEATANKVILQEEADVFANKEDASLVQQVRRRAATLEGRDAPPPALASITSGDSAAVNLEEEASTERLRAAMNATVNLAVSPLDSVLVDEEHLLLHRVVSLDGAVYRQGVIVNLTELERHLAALVMRSAQAAHLELSWDVSADPPPLPEDALHAYRHRFVEPFGVLWASLRITPLPGLSGRAYILSLCALLALFAALGLFAIHRMVSVTLAFAERRNNFVSAVSHELKTPLTAIRMYAEMLRDGMVPTEEKRHQYHETITTESERLSRLVDNVLELSRLEHGERSMDLRSAALGPVLQEAIDTFSIHAEARGFTLELELEDGLPPVRFDRDALLQVVLNLIDNSIKYARDAGDKRITLSGETQDGRALLSVRDHGPGVSHQHADHIFEAFYRGENELTRRTKGTGIGLALVDGLVSRMGGTVTASNAEPTGFRVRISLPT